MTDLETSGVVEVGEATATPEQTPTDAQAPLGTDAASSPASGASVGLLRQAAALMRERAEKATPGPWETYRNMHDECFVNDLDRRGFGVISNPATGRADYGRADAEHIASWHPAVALAVADWLESVAHGWEQTDQHWNHEIKHDLGVWKAPEHHPALAVARTYLGGDR